MFVSSSADVLRIDSSCLLLTSLEVSQLAINLCVFLNDEIHRRDYKCDSTDQIKSNYYRLLDIGI